ncbi:oxygenase [Lithospermum erythrorhizon]|uniref:Flavin-containing monooxygenase n=1 Tax=Lithospermum erythrorhizon TaxID=34254 RepID=A0AAV3RA88_LITER
MQEQRYDFVILTVGKYSGLPNIPVFPPGKGPESFKRNVIHSMDCAKMETGFMKAKNPVVVGLGKTAIDIAMACSAANGIENPCTVLYRTVHWAIPGDLPVPLGYLLLNRFSHLIVHKPEEGFLLKVLATILSPLRWAISKYVERAIIKAVNLRKYDMVPKHGFFQEANSCSAASLPQGFYDRVDEGSIKLVKSQNFNFCEDGIFIEGKGESIKTELVILCTGFRGADKVRDMFMSPFFKKCITASDNDSLCQLYREMIHPRIPQLAVVGMAESVSNLQTAEMMSRWLAELLDGNIKIPSIKDMEKNIAEWDKHLKPSPSYGKRFCVGTYNIWFNDKLCQDMGWNPKRKKSALAELFEPYGPLDYAQPQ